MCYRRYCEKSLESAAGSSLAAHNRPSARALLLCGHLLLDVAPRTDLESAAHPAERFSPAGGRFGSAHDAFYRSLAAVGRERTLRSLENLGRDDRFGFLRFAFHVLTPLCQIQARHDNPVVPGWYYRGNFRASLQPGGCRSARFAL